MSQYGAMGYAQHGWNAAQILAHYYSGTALGTTDPARQVRIQLVAETTRARISGARQAGGRKLDPTATYTLRRRGLSEVELSAGGKRVATFSAPLQVAGDGGVTTLAGHGQLPRRAGVRADGLPRPDRGERRRARRLPAGRRSGASRPRRGPPRR